MVNRCTVNAESKDIVGSIPTFPANYMIKTNNQKIKKELKIAKINYNHHNWIIENDYIVCNNCNISLHNKEYFKFLSCNNNIKYNIILNKQLNIACGKYYINIAVRDTLSQECINNKWDPYWITKDELLRKSGKALIETQPIIIYDHYTSPKLILFNIAQLEIIPKNIQSKLNKILIKEIL